MSTHVYREPFPCDEACEHLDPPCSGGHAVVVTWHNASAITSIHVEPGSPQSGLWLDTGGVTALRLALAREDGDDPRDARIASLQAEVTRLEALIVDAVVSGPGHVPDCIYNECRNIRNRKGESSC